MSKILLLDEPRTSQPQTSAGVDAKYAHKLLGVFNPAAPSPDWALIGSSSASYSPTRNGIALSTNGNTYVKKTVSAHQNTGFTMLCSGFISQVDNTRDIAGIYNGATYQALLYPSPTGFSAYYKNGASVAFPCKTPVVGMPFTITVTGNGSRYYGRLWLDGEITEVSGTYTGTSAYDSVHCGCRFLGRTSKNTLAAFWNRVLSDAECAELVDNGLPWALFAPEQIPIFIPDASTGAPTLSALTASLITSSGCRATVAVAR